MRNYQVSGNKRRNSKGRIEQTGRKSGGLKAGIVLLACVVLAVILAVWKVPAASTSTGQTRADQPAISSMDQPLPASLASFSSPASEATKSGDSPSTGSDWIMAPNNPPLPRTLGDIPPLPVAHSAHDPNFHPVQVQKRETDGDTIVLTCLNPVTNKTEVVVGKSGRDTIFTLNSRQVPPANRRD